MTKKKLKLSKNKIVGGVLGGVAEYLEIDPTIIRIIFILLTFLTMGFGGAIIYLIAWIIMFKS